MVNVANLYNEHHLISDLQQDTLALIRECASIDPVKKLVQCFDILKLTLEIHNKFPRIYPALPICDEGAMIQLVMLTRELAIYHVKELPDPDLYFYVSKVKRLMHVYQLPRR